MLTGLAWFSYKNVTSLLASDDVVCWPIVPCEDVRAHLSRATVRALEHRDGCGDDGRQDCFACLRESTLLDDALKAIEGRPAPRH